MTGPVNLPWCISEGIGGTGGAQRLIEAMGQGFCFTWGGKTDDRISRRLAEGQGP